MISVVVVLPLQNVLKEPYNRKLDVFEQKADAVVSDFWDLRRNFFKGQFWARREVYRSIGANLQMPGIRAGLAR